MKARRFSLAVFAAMVVASIALGILNNFRVDAEKRVPLEGYPDSAEETDEDGDS